METVLVTGGAGFIGANYIHLLLRDSNVRVVNLDALTYAGNLDNLRNADPARHVFVHGNINSGELIRSLLSEYRPTSIVHFAAESHVDRSIEGPASFIETNINGTFTLLEAAKEYWRNLAPARDDFRFVHISTDEVYGTLGNEGRFHEWSPYRPNSPYAASKAASDHLVRAYGHTYGFPAVITHCGNNYGPYQFPEKLIPHIILRALKGLSLPVYGNGRNVRDWIYVEDHCTAVDAVRRKGVPGETYNIGAESEMENIDLVRMICRLLDEAEPRETSYESLITFVPDRPGHDLRYAIEPRKVRSELQWQPKETLASGLMKTLSWYLENRSWCERISSGEYRLQRLGLSEGVEV